MYFAAILAVERIEKHFGANNRTGGEPLLEAGFAAAVCVFAVTVKLPAVPILLLLPLWWIFAEDKWHAAILLVAPAAFVAAPFVARNVVQTGYLLYPFARLDLFSFDWKVPGADVQSMEYAVKYYAINSDRQNWHRTDQMALPEQIQLWLRCHDYYGAALLPWLFLGGTALLMVITIRRARQSPSSSGTALYAAFRLLAFSCVLQRSPTQDTLMVGACFSVCSRLPGSLMSWQLARPVGRLTAGSSRVTCFLLAAYPGDSGNRVRVGFTEYSHSSGLS